MNHHLQGADPSPGIRTTMRQIRAAAAFMRPHRRLWGLLMLSTVAFAVLDAFGIVVLIPFLNTLFGGSALPDSGGRLGEIMRFLFGWLPVEGRPPESVLPVVILFMLAVFMLQNLAGLFRAVFLARLEQRVTCDMRVAAFDHLTRVEAARVVVLPAGQVVARLTTDIDQVRSLLTRHGGDAVSALLRLMAALAALLVISPKLTLASLVVFPPLVLMWAPLLSRLRRADRLALDLAGDLNGRIHESASGMRTIRLSGSEQDERDRFRTIASKHRDAVIGAETRRSAVSPMTEMIGAVGTVLILWYGGRLVLVEGVLDGASLVAFLALSVKLYSPAKALARFPAMLQPALASADRLQEFLGIAEERQDGHEPPRSTASRIEVCEVVFGYEPGRPVLNSISLTIQPGEVVALVGPSGAGKTTLLELLSGLHAPSQGRIVVDGVDVATLRPSAHRSRLAFVPQDVFLFRDTVLENIRRGAPDASRDQVMRAAVLAGAGEFIDELPEGYDTLLADRGNSLSGGQKQRLAIARALIREPSVVILDEATSSLDGESEERVARSVREVAAGRTVIISAHRASAVQWADRILVVEGGRVVEEGDHATLMREGRVYPRLFSDG
jgi:ATP-binding cassette, subfamily B, bacterial MsbA